MVTDGALGRLLLLALACAPAGAARAQASHEGIVVTGERRSQPKSAVPSSVAAYGPDEIDAIAGADRLEAILVATPNVQLGSGGEGPTIRGQDTNGPLRDLSAFLGGNRPRGTLVIDGRPVSYNELAYGVAQLWDVERVEVYRSPQTTTQGRNAIAGAIFVETKAPTFDWEGRVRVAGGKLGTRQASAALSGPLLSDELAFRLAGDIRHSATASRITSRAPGDYNSDDYRVVRLKLLATPSAAPGLRLSGAVTHNRSSAPQIEGVRAPFKERRDAEATYGLFRVRSDALSLRLDYPLDRSWSAAASLAVGDATIRRIAPPGFGAAVNEVRDYTAEAIVTGRPTGALVVLAGVNRTVTRLDQQIDLRAALLGRGGFDDRQAALGVFGQAEWTAAPLTVSLGARYQEDDQRRSGALVLDGPASLALDYSRQFAKLLPKASVSLQLSPGVRLGGLIQRAYNPGGATLDVRRGTADTFEAEHLWALEGFVRIYPPSLPLTVSANLFRYDFTDAQRVLLRELATPGGIVTVAETGNAPKARSSGAEVEAEWRPLRGLTLRGELGLLQTRITRTLLRADPLRGRAFQRAPGFSGVLGADWRPTSELRVGVRVRANSGYFSDDLNDEARRVKGAAIVDLSGQWRRGNLLLAGFVRNALDRFYLTYRFSAASRLATAGDPREWGLSAEYSF